MTYRQAQKDWVMHQLQQPKSFIATSQQKCFHCHPIKQVDNRNKSATIIENKKVMGDASCGLHYNSSLKRMWVHLTFNQVVAGSIPARPTNKLIAYVVVKKTDHIEA